MIIAIYQTQHEIGYMTRPLWNRLGHTKKCLRVLFTRATNEEMDGIDEINMISESKCANMLWNVLNDNPFTSNMN